VNVSEHGLELLNLTCTWHIVTVSRIRGNFTEALLSQALKTLQLRHPALRKGITGSIEAPQLVEFDPAPPVPLRVVSIAQAEDWSAIANTELNQKIDSAQGLLRAVLVQVNSDPKLHYLITASHHAISDGLSCIQLHSEILTICQHQIAGTDPNLPPLPEVPSITSLLPTAFQPGKGESKGLLYAISLGLKRKFFRLKTLPADTSAPLGDRHCYLISQTLPPAVTQQLIQSCKQQNLGVNAAIAAALLTTARQQINSRQRSQQKLCLSCDSAVDVRRRLPIPWSREHLTNLAPWVRTFYIIRPQDSFWQIAQKVQQKLQQAIARQDMFRALWGALIMADYTIKHPQEVQATAFVSNVGKLEIPQSYGEFELEDITFTASNAVFAGVFAVYVTTYQSQMRLNFMFSEPAFDRSTLQALVDAAMDSLYQAIGESRSPNPQSSRSTLETV
jgi:NRPS condensation-like uncharacterized protein